MNTTDTSEGGLEALIVRHLVEANGYEQGTNADYDREYAIDEARLWRFLKATLPVDSGFHAICEPVDVSQGSVSRTPVHPRDVFCEAVRYRAYAILVAHNHPSGDPRPSQEDIEITERLIETGRLLGIRLIDHLVIGSPDSAGGRGFVSIRNLATLKF